MVAHSVTYTLELSQEQIEAFIEFKEAGSRIFYKHCDSLVKHACWGKACVSTVFISAINLPSAAKCNVILTEEHAQGLRDMLKLADELQSESLAKSPGHLSAEAEELYKKMFSALRVFRDAVEKAMAKN